MIHDRDLQRSVLAELSWDPSVTAAHIGVTADQGIVSLTGHVESYGEKHAAEMATRRVKGVKALVEGLEVRLPSAGRIDDDDIARMALARLEWHVVDPAYKVAIKVEKGWLTLTGIVEWHYQKDATEAEIRRLPGVVGIDNQITIKAQVVASNVSDDITHALHRSWFFDPETIDVSADGGTVRLNGTVMSSHERKLAAETAWAAPGVTMVENNLMIV